MTASSDLRTRLAGALWGLFAGDALADHAALSGEIDAFVEAACSGRLLY